MLYVNRPLARLTFKRWFRRFIRSDFNLNDHPVLGPHSVVNEDTLLASMENEPRFQRNVLLIAGNRYLNCLSPFEEILVHFQTEHAGTTFSDGTQLDRLCFSGDFYVAT